MPRFRIILIPAIRQPRLDGDRSGLPTPSDCSFERCDFATGRTRESNPDTRGNRTPCSHIWRPSPRPGVHGRIGAAGWDRTINLPIISRALIPVELQRHIVRFCFWQTENCHPVSPSFVGDCWNGTRKQLYTPGTTGRNRTATPSSRQLTTFCSYPPSRASMAHFHYATVV